MRSRACSPARNMLKCRLCPRTVVDAYKAGQAAIAAKDKEINGVPQGRSRAAESESAAAISSKRWKPSCRSEARKKLAGLRAELEGLKKKAPPQVPVIHALGEASRAG